MANVSPVPLLAGGQVQDSRRHSHWLPLFLIAYGLWVLLPWTAPELMHLGLFGPGHAVYFVYSFFCHQLPERSYFLFGPRPMYSLATIQATWQNSFDPTVLRKFVGNAGMGWKVAWSDRMISFYGSVWIFALIWAILRRRIRALPWWGFGMLLLPIVLDGGTHMISDLAGIGQGFRYGNQWLAAITHGALPAAFYVGDALGSFNSWMRLITGVLAGLGIVWFVFPYVESALAQG